jgi:hypothetical protein
MSKVRNINKGFHHYFYQYSVILKCGIHETKCSSLMFFKRMFSYKGLHTDSSRVFSLFSYNFHPLFWEDRMNVSLLHSQATKFKQSGFKKENDRTIHNTKNLGRHHDV